MLSNMIVDFLVHINSPDRQRDLSGNVVRPRTGEFVRSTHGSKKVHSPIFEEETTRGGPFCRGAEHRSDPIASYVAVMVFYPWVAPALGLIIIRNVGKPTDL